MENPEEGRAAAGQEALALLVAVILMEPSSMTPQKSCCKEKKDSKHGQKDIVIRALSRMRDWLFFTTSHRHREKDSVGHGHHDCGWCEHNVHELLEIQRGIRRGIWQIVHLLTPKQLTHHVVVVFDGGMVENNVLVLNVGQTSQASIVPLLADGITNSGGVLSNVVFNFNDPSATVVLNADGVTATVTGIAQSSGPVQGTATCTVTDTDSVVSQWSQVFSITTNAVEQQQLTQSVAVQFTDPVDANAPAGVSSAKKPLNE